MELSKIFYYRKKLLQTIGFEKATVSSLKFLKIEIEEELNEKIGFNTLRRFFGILQLKTPNTKTWKVLTDYLNSKSGNKKQDEQSYLLFWKSHHQLLVKITSLSNESIIDYLIKERKTDNFPILLGYVTNHLIATRDIQSLEILYKNEIIFEEHDSFSNFLAELVHPLLMKIKGEEFSNLLPIINLKLFKESVLYYHIGYSYLNGNYGKILNQMVADSPSEQLFLDCILGYYKFLAGGELDVLKELELAELKTYYPTLAGRYLGYCILLHPENTPEIIKQFVKPLSAHFTPHYFYLEIMSALLFTKDFNSIRHIIDRHYEALYEIDHWYAFSTLNMYQVAEAMVYLSEKKLKRAAIVIDSINLESTSSDYYNYISLFYSIAKYHILQGEKDFDTSETVYKKYIETAQKMGFYRFNQEFLLHFFR